MTTTGARAAWLAAVWTVAAVVLSMPNAAHAACTEGATGTSTAYGCTLTKVCRSGVWTRQACAPAATAVCTTPKQLQGTPVCQPDEEFGELSCVPVGCTAPEQCNNYDDNLDGAVDNMAPRACGDASCPTQARQTCSAGVWGACQGGGGSRACTGSCPSAPANAGTQVCSSAGAWGACVSPEICNNCDDNFDGTVDNSVPTKACENTCSIKGTATCSAGAWTCSNAGGTMPCSTQECNTAGTQACTPNGSPTGVCKAPVETCNDCDDTKEGLVDEGLSCQPCDT